MSATQPSVWMLIIPAIAGLAGVIVGALFTRANDKRKQKLEFIAQQLREFYSPLLGIRTHILSMSELRETVRDKAAIVWGELVDEAQQHGDPTAISQLRQTRWAEFERLIEAGDQQFRDELLPLYKEMLKTFREKYWLAQPSTREHYAALLRYVELWTRHFDQSYPREVVGALDIREAPLHPFYADLKEQFEWLQGMLHRADV